MGEGPFLLRRIVDAMWQRRHSERCAHDRHPRRIAGITFKQTPEDSAASSWRCERCPAINPPSLVRCSHCLGWKGGRVPIRRKVASAHRGKKNAGASTSNPGRNRQRRAGAASAVSKNDDEAAAIATGGAPPKRPVLKVGAAVYAAYWPPHDPTRSSAPSWYPGVVSSYKIGKVSADKRYGYARVYSINYDDGDVLDDVPDHFVFAAGEYFLQQSRHPGVRNVMDKGSKDAWARHVGWYVASIDGRERAFSTLSGALRASGASISVSSKGWADDVATSAKNDTKELSRVSRGGGNRHGKEGGAPVLETLSSTQPGVAARGSSPRKRAIDNLFDEGSEVVARKKLAKASLGDKKNSSDDISSPMPSMGNPENLSKHNKNDVFLSLKDPAYKAVMFDQFLKMEHDSTAMDNSAIAKKVFQLFQKKGGRFFKLPWKSTKYIEVDKHGALEKIKSDIDNRMKSSRSWLKRDGDMIWARHGDHDGAAEHAAFRIRNKKSRPGYVWVEWTSNRTIEEIPETNISVDLTSRRRNRRSGSSRRPISTKLAVDGGYLPSTTNIKTEGVADHSNRSISEIPETNISVDLAFRQRNRRSSSSSRSISTKLAVDGDHLPSATNIKTEGVADHKRNAKTPDLAMSGPRMEAIKEEAETDDEAEATIECACIKKDLDGAGNSCDNADGNGIVGASGEKSMTNASEIDRREFKPGSRVIVLRERGEEWQATIREHREEKGSAGFVIHYDGCRSAEHWVPSERVVDFLHAGSEVEPSHVPEKTRKLKEEVSGNVETSETKSEADGQVKIEEKGNFEFSMHQQYVPNSKPSQKSYKAAMFGGYQANAEMSEIKPEADIRTKTEDNDVEVAIPHQNIHMQNQKSEAANQPGLPFHGFKQAKGSSSNTTQAIAVSISSRKNIRGQENNKNGTEYNQNDVFLSLNNPAYKAVMYACFKKLGKRSKQGREMDMQVAYEVFQSFKKAGGRFFKPQSDKSTYIEVGEWAALKKIERDIIQRMATSCHWLNCERKGLASNSQSTSADLIKSSVNMAPDKSMTDKIALRWVPPKVKRKSLPGMSKEKQNALQTCERNNIALIKMKKEMSSEEISNKQRSKSFIKRSVSIAPDKSMTDEIALRWVPPKEKRKSLPGMSEEKQNAMQTCERNNIALIKMKKEMASEEISNKQRSKSLITRSVNTAPDKSMTDEIALRNKNVSEQKHPSFATGIFSPSEEWKDEALKVDESAEKEIVAESMEEGDKHRTMAKGKLPTLHTLEEAALPGGWIEALDPTSGRSYYYQQSTGKSTWEKPLAVPEGWVEALDATSGSSFYHQQSTGKSTWARPTALPEGWVEALDSTSRRSYYYQQSTGKSTWERPTASQNDVQGHYRSNLGTDYWYH